MKLVTTKDLIYVLDSYYKEKIAFSQVLEILNEKANERLNFIYYGHLLENTKDKEPISFEKWLELKKVKKLMDTYYWDGINLKYYSKSELIRIYLKTASKEI